MGINNDIQKIYSEPTELNKIIKIKRRQKHDLYLDVHINSNYSADNEIQLILLIRDISRIKLAEKEIQQKAIELTNLIQTVDTPIWGIDSNGRINEWNRAAEKITDYKKEEVLNKDFSALLFAESTKKTIRELIAKSIFGLDVSATELEIITKKGKKIKILLNISAYREQNGKIIGVLCTAQDITTHVNYRKKLEKNRKRIGCFKIKICFNGFARV